MESSFVQNDNQESGFGQVIKDFHIVLESAKDVLLRGSVPGTNLH